MSYGYKRTDCVKVPRCLPHTTPGLIRIYPGTAPPRHQRPTAEQAQAWMREQGWFDGAPLGRRARYYGPPFQDSQLQNTYLEESRKLAASSAFVTLGTARELVASVINAGLAAADAATPAIEARVRREAESAAKIGVGQMFLGGIAVAALGLSAWALLKSKRR